jgi:ABC-2 type transport system permease protein
MLLPTAAYLVFIYVHSDPVPPWRLLVAGYVGVMLLGGCLLSLGSFISSLTENPLIAAVLTFAAFLGVWVIDLGRNAGGGAGSVLEYLSVIRHFDDFTRGVIDSSSLIYYASFMILFVFLTVRAVDSMRWRRA